MEDRLMDGDVYVAEYIIRERLAAARARAKVAVLRGEANQASRQPTGFTHQLLELGRSFVKRRGQGRPVLDVRPEEGHSMTYTAKPLACDPTKLRGLSEKLILSHWENNYGGAVRRLNAIASQLAELNFASAPVFVINGLKREELIATNSMILHELYFDGL